MNVATQFVVDGVTTLCAAHDLQRRKYGFLLPLRPKNGPCKVTGCNTKWYSHGYCQKHHYRWKVNGDPLLTQIQSKGSGTLTKSGYRQVVIDGRSKAEHRWFIEQHLGRPLWPDENVHHKNGNRADNRLSNLEIWTTKQPCGQRVEDKVAYAVEILERYAPDLLQAKRKRA